MKWLAASALLLAGCAATPPGLVTIVPGSEIVPMPSSISQRQVDRDFPLSRWSDPVHEFLDRPGFSGMVSFSNNANGGWYLISTKQWQRGEDLAAVWRWASISKQVTAVLVLQEVAKGTIDLDLPVARYLPRFRSPNAATLTVRQLLRHQSGLPNPDDTLQPGQQVAAYYQPGYKGSRNPLTGFCAGPVKGQPGGNWSYNNCDYIVAGKLLEAVTGQSFAKLLNERIAEPIFGRTIGIYPTRKATVPGTIGGKPEPTIDLASYGSAGAIYGSIQDLMAFDSALMNGTLLPKAQLAELWDGRPELGYMALGQWVFTVALKDCSEPVKIVERRGAIGGVQLRNYIFPERDSHMQIMVNRAETDFDMGELWQGSGFAYDLVNTSVCKLDKQ